MAELLYAEIDRLMGENEGLGFKELFPSATEPDCNESKTKFVPKQSKTAFQNQIKRNYRLYDATNQANIHHALARRPSAVDSDDEASSSVAGSLNDDYENLSEDESEGSVIDDEALGGLFSPSNRDAHNAPDEI